MQKLAGSWTGTYEYVEPQIPGSRRVEFTLEIVSAPSWLLHGEVSDDPMTGGGCGTISGWSFGRHVWFQKIMPEVYVAHDPRPIPLDEYLQTEFGEGAAGEAAPHTVSYRGVAAPDRNSVAGTWKIPHRRVVLASGRVVALSFGRGTWEMHRNGSKA